MKGKYNATGSPPLLQELVKEPEILISNIPVQNAEELTLQLSVWNNTLCLYPLHTPLHKLISERAEAIPGKTAVTFGKQKITYKQINEQANQLSRLLIKNGAKKGDRVAFALDRSVEMLVALLAIMKTGAVYVPLDPQFPLNRINYMLEDSQAVILLTSQKHKGYFESKAKELVLEDEWPSLKDYDTAEPDVEVNGDDLVYILYTSGSTGNPKGVQIAHHNLVNFLTSMQSAPGITAEDKLLAVTTISFDIAGLEMFLPLLTGAEIILAGTSTAKDGRALLEIIKNEGVTMMQATPYTWRIMLEAGWDEATPLKVICGGEALPQELAQKLLTRASSLWNVYGPTETTVWSTLKQLTANDKVISIGRPIHNTSVYILDKFLKPLSPGVAGEIYIGGDGVAKGYLNRPELTAEKFIDDPFVKQTGAKMYRTGDLGKFLPDGEIECLGRMDAQVKIRGYRIETGEIEFQLTREKDIKEAVVIAKPDHLGVDKLVAFIITGPDHSPAADASKQVQRWKDSLKKSLPDYMVPDNFITIPAMPLTPNGKVDRKALAKHGAAANQEEYVYVAPRTDIEKLVADIWIEYLGVKKVSVHDDFFELGGHSLIAVKVMGRIEKETGKRLPLATLFESPTVEKLAHTLELGAKSITWDSLVPIKPTGNKPPLYIIHGEGLNLLNFSNLAAFMDKERPIFGLQAVGLNGIDEPLDSLPEIARFYLNEIIRHNPSGPYFLAGYSFGGYVAMEINRQMVAMGKEIKMLIMFDTDAEKSEYKDWYFLLQKKVKRNVPVLISLLKSSMRYPLTDFRNQFKSRYPNFLYKYTTKKESKSFYELIQKIKDKHLVAFRNYKMEPFDGKVHLYKAKICVHYVYDTEFLGWKKYAKAGVEVHDVPGDHLSMLLPPNVEEFASILSRALDGCKEKVQEKVLAG